MNKKIFELIKNGKIKKVIPFDFSGTSYAAGGNYINSRSHYASYVGFGCYHSWNATADVCMIINFPNPIGSPASFRVQFSGLVHGFLTNSRIVYYYTDGTTETISLGTLSLDYNNRYVTTTKKHKEFTRFDYYSTYVTGAGGQSSNAGVNIYPVTQTIWK